MKWVVQTSFVGDCVLSLPFLHELLKLLEMQNPQGQIIWVTQPGIQEQMMALALERSFNKKRLKVILRVLDKRGHDRSLLKTYSKVRGWARAMGKPDEVYCLQRSFRSALVALASGAEERIGFGSGAASFMYTKSIARSWDIGVHEIEKNLDLLRVNHEISSWEDEPRPSFLGASQRPIRKVDCIAVALGSPWPTKRWPVEHVASYVERMTQEGFEVNLIGDPSAREIADAVIKKNDSLLIKDHVGKTGAKDWVDLIDQCGVLVSGDSASVHVASDLGVPVLALFGPTIPDFGFAPWRRGSRVLQVKDLPCRPCDIHGPKKCPLRHHRCLVEISPERVFRETKDLLVDPPKI